MFFSVSNTNRRQAVPIVKEKEYKLLEKSDKQKVTDFNDKAFSVPENADTFTRVVIGKEKDTNYKQEITSFYDKDNKLVKRCYKDNSGGKKVRTYTCANSITADFNPIKIRNIQTKEYSDADENYYLPHWKILSDETQITENSSRKSNKVLIHKNEYENKIEGRKERPSHIKASVSEYYSPKRFKPKRQPKKLVLDIAIKDNLPEITGITTQNITSPQKEDLFLAYRLLAGEQKQEALAEYYLKKHGLSDAGIKVATDASQVAPRAAACFQNRNSAIYFKEELDTPAGIAAHEAEHAYQYKLIGQLGESTSTYEKRCRELYGKIFAPKAIEEAEQYKTAALNYPGPYYSGKLFNMEDYRKNLLEIKAKEAEEKAEKEYNKTRSFWADQFSLSKKGNWF